MTILSFIVKKAKCTLGKRKRKKHWMKNKALHSHVLALTVSDIVVC